MAGTRGPGGLPGSSPANPRSRGGPPSLPSVPLAHAHPQPLPDALAGGAPRGPPCWPRAPVPHHPLPDAIGAAPLAPPSAAPPPRRGSRPPRARTASIALLLVGGLAVGLTVGQQRQEAPAAEQTRTALL